MPLKPVMTKACHPNLQLVPSLNLSKASILKELPLSCHELDSLLCARINVITYTANYRGDTVDGMRCFDGKTLLPASQVKVVQQYVTGLLDEDQKFLIFCHHKVMNDGIAEVLNK